MYDDINYRCIIFKCKKVLFATEKGTCFNKMSYIFDLAGFVS